MCSLTAGLTMALPLEPECVLLLQNVFSYYRMCSLTTGLTMALPLEPREFKLGMIIFFCMPCTINSGAVLAKQAGGNFAMALLLTVAGIYFYSYYLFFIIIFIVFFIGNLTMALLLTVAGIFYYYYFLLLFLLATLLWPSASLSLVFIDLY